jgi:hypothetical protein
VIWRRILLLLAVSTLAACDLVGLSPSGGVYPAACGQLGFQARQCAAIVTRAQANASIKKQDVASIDILPPSAVGGVQLGGRMVARVRFHLASATERTEEVWCVGILGQGDLACADDPTIGIAGGVDHDVPCTGGGDPPRGCATPPPTPRPASQALARPLHIAALDIPLDHIGGYQVEVGAAGLPDGVLTRRSATLADPRPEAFWVDGGILLDVRPVDPRRPPVGSVYRDPFDGVETVKVFLVFSVTEATPGAVLQVRDLIVE